MNILKLCHEHELLYCDFYIMPTDIIFFIAYLKKQEPTYWRSCIEKPLILDAI